MDSDFGFGYSHRHKRPHAQMENEGPSSPTWSSFRRLSASREPSISSISIGGPSQPHPHMAGIHLPRIRELPTPAPPPHRFAGDGFDFRRPANLARADSQPVIDLTADDAAPPVSDNRPARPPRSQRPPRFSRDIIISLDDDEDEVDEAGVRRAAPRSPEIEFISSRTVEQPQRSAQYNDNEDDELVITGSNTLAREDPENRQRYLRDRLRRDRRMQAEVERVFHRQFGERLGLHHHAMGPVPPLRNVRRGDHRGHMRFNFVAPDLDFGMVGFEMEPPRPRETPPAPTYNPPPTAPEGFTRTPSDEAYVCPNCNDELCVGDSDVKKQVWIVKTCGHMYCGECAVNRYSKKSVKGKERAPPLNHRPFKQCMVDGCGKPVSQPRALIQVFL